MNNFSAWLRQLFSRIGASFRNFMSGRYGTDKLNMVILGSGVLVSLIASFIQIKLYSETQVNRTRNAMLFRLIITESQTMSIEKPTLLEKIGKYWKAHCKMNLQ